MDQAVVVQPLPAVAVRAVYQLLVGVLGSVAFASRLRGLCVCNVF